MVRTWLIAGCLFSFPEAFAGSYPFRGTVGLSRSSTPFAEQYRECCVFWNNGAENGATEDPMEALLGGKWS